ncbi:hypothetical protein OAF54_00120 [bacterium]|nr:hypothetical protein [bacterium]
MKEILEALEDIDTEDWEVVIFRDIDAKGGVNGLLIGTPEFITAVTEGFEEDGGIVEEHDWETEEDIEAALTLVPDEDKLH